MIANENSIPTAVYILPGQRIMLSNLRFRMSL